MTVTTAKTVFDKVWDEHIVSRLDDGAVLLRIDRHFFHDLSGSEGLQSLKERGLVVRSPELTTGATDHVVSTTPGRQDHTPVAQTILKEYRALTGEFGIRVFDEGHKSQGIVHVIGPELGLSLPGATIVCPDSHTSTHGGLGAIAFGIGTSELEHVLATQVLVQRKPKTMRVSFTGTRGVGVTAKDMALHLIGKIGAGAGTGYAIEYAGPAIRELDIEGRLTLCNLSIELGARMGMVAADEKTFAYLKGRQYAPTGDMWEQAVAHWRTLQTDEGAVFDLEVEIDVAQIAPQITWGTSPQDVMHIHDVIPDPAAEPDPHRRAAMQAALNYMGLEAGVPIIGTPVDVVFIGSCTNSRLSDLRDAAAVARLGRVAAGVKAWVVPGSETVKRAAEAEGLDQVFIEAGFEWREPGCSMCLAVNGETVAPGKRSVSTTNRNFVGRQGPGARTHLASPAMAAAAAIAGCITDSRQWS